MGGPGVVCRLETITLLLNEIFCGREGLGATTPGLGISNWSPFSPRFHPERTKIKNDSAEPSPQKISGGGRAMRCPEPEFNHWFVAGDRRLRSVADPE
jgi:hypothetical protein